MTLDVNKDGFKCEKKILNDALVHFNCRFLFIMCHFSPTFTIEAVGSNDLNTKLTNREIIERLRMKTLLIVRRASAACKH